MPHDLHLFISHAVTVNVKPVDNDPPVATDDSATTDEDTPITIDVVDGSFGGTDSDVDGDTLTTSLLSDPSNGSASLSAGGTFVYNPDPNFHGLDSFVYSVSDGTGLTATATGACLSGQLGV